VRLAYEVRKKQEHVKFWPTVKLVYNEHTNPSMSAMQKQCQGMYNLFRGFVPTVYGIIPYAGVSFLAYETIKDHFLNDPLFTPYTLSGSTYKDKPMMKVWAHLLCGAISGALAQTSSYPFEVIRRNMQVSGLHKERYKYTTLQTARYIYKTRSFRGFFVGLTIGYLKVAPMFAVSFYCYEWAKRLLAID
jgi:solute carrier family 25 protein 16